MASDLAGRLSGVLRVFVCPARRDSGEVTNVELALARGLISGRINSSWSRIGPQKKVRERMHARRVAVLCAVVGAIVGRYALGAAGTAREPWFENVDALVVTISPVGSPGSEMMDWDELKRKVEMQFKDAGVHIPGLDTPSRETFLLERAAQVDDAWGWVQVKVRFSRAPESSLFALCVETKLVRRVILPHRQDLGVAAPLGEVGGEIQFASEEELQGKIEATVDDHIRSFVFRLKTARAAQKNGSDESGSGRQEAGQGTGASGASNVGQQGARDESSRISSYPYVASKNSNIFHKSTCSSAKKIASDNMVGYGSRQEAIGAGKRPCERCKP